MMDNLHWMLLLAIVMPFIALAAAAIVASTFNWIFPK
jgi:hypothetical protein